MNTTATRVEPLAIDGAPKGSKENLRKTEKGLGFVPNLTLEANFVEAAQKIDQSDDSPIPIDWG